MQRCELPVRIRPSMTLSFGAAVALEDRFAPRREAMISLKILR